MDYLRTVGSQEDGVSRYRALRRRRRQLRPPARYEIGYVDPPNQICRTSRGRKARRDAVMKTNLHPSPAKSIRTAGLATGVPRENYYSSP